MRVFLIALVAELGACSGSAPSGTRPSREPVAMVSPKRPRPAPQRAHAAVDTIAVLAGKPTEVAWIIPAAAQLTLGGGALTPRDETTLLEVDLLEQRGADVRVGLRLGGLRFALWTERASLLVTVNRDEQLRGAAGGDKPARAEASIVLRDGARVQRLAREGDWTKVRYLGNLEAEGWIPTSSLVDVGPAGRTTTRRWGGGRASLATPGYAIRAEPAVTGRLLAATTFSTSVGLGKQLDPGWAEVTFEDSDLVVHGFASKHEPPVPIHSRRRLTSIRPAGPDRLPEGTCLYAGDDAIGVVVGEAHGTLGAGMRPGWFTFTVDTPWDALALDVRGPIETQLRTCTSSLP